MGDATGKYSSVHNGEQGPCRHLILLLPRFLLHFSEDFLEFQTHSLELGFASLILMRPSTRRPSQPHSKRGTEISLQTALWWAEHQTPHNPVYSWNNIPKSYFWQLRRDKEGLQLRVLSTLPGDSSSVSNTHIRWLTACSNTSSRRSNAHLLSPHTHTHSKQSRILQRSFAQTLERLPFCVSTADAERSQSGLAPEQPQ